MSDLPPILYEDDAIIAFNKPSGLLIAPDRWDKNVENLMTMVHEKLSPDWFNAHRIDKDTSGIVLCAKTKPALDDLCRQFESKKIVKTYFALTRNTPRNDRGRIELALVEDSRKPGTMRISKSGKLAATEFEVVERWRKFALLRCTPLTGRTHQIRVHLASIRCLILGDPLYGNGKGLFLSEIKRDYKQKKHEAERPLIWRLALHAESVIFEHPVTHQPVTVTAPMPAEFELAIKYLRKYGGGGRG